MVLSIMRATITITTTTTTIAEKVCSKTETTNITTTTAIATAVLFIRGSGPGRQGQFFDDIGHGVGSAAAWSRGDTAVQANAGAGR